MSSQPVYVNPLCTRYASREMQEIFSNDTKFRTWRLLWIALAESEMELGLPITQAQIEEMRQNVDNIDYDKAAEYEHKFRHDVMAHVHTFGDVCPSAKGIIHLGATSCYVGDNTDIIVMRRGLVRVRELLLSAIEAVAAFAEQHKGLASLAYTHFQAAQPTTIGKRATLWLQDLMNDLEQVEFQMQSLKLLGCKGTTGTGASFMELFGGDMDKVVDLEKRIAGKMNFDACVAVSGQTYSRKTDYNVLSALCGIAQTATKFSNDIRLMSHLKEFDEPFEAGQIGSSAMAYKRNPMRSERIASLSRYIMTDVLNPAITASAQWFERTLDDSANKRISVPEAFLATDAVLSLMINVISGGTVYPNVIRKHLLEELPFMATENILMYCVKKGGDRQALHEAIREHSVDTAKQIKLHGGDNDLLDRIAADPRFGLTRDEVDAILEEGGFTGMAEAQTEFFLREYVRPLLKKYQSIDRVQVEINI